MSEREELLAEVLRLWDCTKTSIERIESTRQLRIIRTNNKKVLVTPKERSDAQKNANRQAQQRFYARQREKILERKRLKRNAVKARERETVLE